MIDLHDWILANAYSAVKFHWASLYYPVLLFYSSKSTAVVNGYSIRIVYDLSIIRTTEQKTPNYPNSRRSDWKDRGKIRWKGPEFALFSSNPGVSAAERALRQTRLAN